MTRPDARLDTQTVHAGEPRPGIAGAVETPIFQTAMFEYQGEQGYDAVRYIRLNNTPNHLSLHGKLASLEGGEAALVAGSGMAAMTAAVLSTVSAGEHVLAQNRLYGGTFDFLTRDLPGLGIACDFIDAERPETWSRHLRPTTRAIIVESITNPLMQVGALASVPPFAREHGLTSIIDNTFATPVNFRPIALGYDLVHHSATKYLNGHSDIVAGALVGRHERIEKALHKLNRLGGTLDPHACFLLQRGMKTLALRVRRQNDNALRLATFLEGRPGVTRVNYPGLASNPGHERARALFKGFGGMLSFELAGGVEAAERVMGRLTIPIKAPSLGGVESLVIRPALTSHAGMTPEERQAMGISDGLIRVSVGIEDPDDLVEDFGRALG